MLGFGNEVAVRNSAFNANNVRVVVTDTSEAQPCWTLQFNCLLISCPETACCQQGISWRSPTVWCNSLAWSADNTSLSSTPNLTSSELSVWCGYCIRFPFSLANCLKIFRGALVVFYIAFVDDVVVFDFHHTFSTSTREVDQATCLDISLYYFADARLAIRTTSLIKLVSIPQSFPPSFHNDYSTPISRCDSYHGEF